MNNFTHHPLSLIPLYFWHGGRPPITDLEADQTGWLICLCLNREGDLSLLPLAWQINAPDEHHTLAPGEQPYPTIHTEALDDAAVTLTLRRLQQDGWQLHGRLTLTFTGRDTVLDFEQTYRRYLWQTPNS